VVGQAGGAGQGTGDLAGQVARGGHGVAGQRLGDLALDRRDGRRTAGRDVDRVHLVLQAGQVLRHRERDVHVRGVVAGRLADDPDDLEGRRLAALVADGDGGPGLQLVLRRVGQVDQRDLGARVRGGERPARAELARAERAEFAAPDVDPGDAEVAGREVGAEALAAVPGTAAAGTAVPGTAAAGTA